MSTKSGNYAKSLATVDLNAAKPPVAAKKIPSFINQDCLTSEPCSCRRELVPDSGRPHHHVDTFRPCLGYNIKHSQPHGHWL